MKAALQLKAKTPSSAPPTLTPVRSRLLQRKCACGRTADSSGECEECARKPRLLQRKTANLSEPPSGRHCGDVGRASVIPVAPPSDLLEADADRIAEAVMSGGPVPAPRRITGSAALYRQAAGQQTGIDTGDLTRALNRPLPSRRSASGPLTPCLTGPVCQNIPGSATRFVAQTSQTEAANAAARQRSPRLQRERGDFRPATQLTRFLTTEDPGTLALVAGVIVNPDISATGAQFTGCEHLRPPPTDAAAGCIEVGAALETQAGAFNAGTAARVGDFSREEWRQNTLRVFTHEGAHAAFDRAPPAGLTLLAGDPASELDELNAILSEMPHLFEMMKLRATSHEDHLEQFRAAIGRTVTRTGEGIRGIMTSLRCMEPCATVDRNVRLVFEARAAQWPAAVRQLVLSALNDPALQLSWPVSVPTPSLQLEPGNPGELDSAPRVETRPLQRLADDESALPFQAPPLVHEVLQSSGHPLDPAVRAFMEPRFGHDFGAVRVHEDSRAAASAREVNALAYTVEKNIVLGEGQYAPNTTAGSRLLAHELAHVVQQEGAGSAGGGPLQRRCACGGAADPGGECAECREKKRHALQRFASLGQPVSHHFDQGDALAQTRLEVNPPDDRFEREAEAAADAVMNGSAAGSPADLSAMSSPAVHRESLTRGSAPVAPPIVHDVLSESGEPLDSSTRGFMEERFGHDFSHVRTHTGAKATESARAVSAAAYTVGRQICFDAQHYAPHTEPGRRLLAHELAHVLQQQGSAAGTLQRAVPAGLEVKGKETAGATGGTWSVYFERNNATLDTDGKIAVHFANRDPKADFDLRGYVSEDEVTSPAVGQALAENRIKAVDTELSLTGHSGKRNAQPFPNVGDGRLDYRDMRSVEIAAAGAKATTPDCKTTAANGPCTAAVETKLAETLTAAQGFISKARRLLTSGIDTETNDLRDEYFGGGAGKGSGAAVTTTLDTNLGKIAAQMDLVAKPKQHQCGTVCNPNCGAIAYNQNAGPTAKLTLCPAFIDAGLTIRARNLIHETAHGAPDIGIAGKTPGTEDWAYGPERRLPRLTAAQALQNSDSYAYFVMLSADPTAAPPRRPEDEVSGVKTNEEGGVRETLTLLADWLKWSPQELRGTYATMVESRSPKTAWTNSHYEKTMKLVAARFGLTMPPTLPTDDDRFAVAGISDRYERMGALSRRKLNVTRDPAVKKTVWSDGPGNSVTLGDDFFAITDAVARTRLLLTALVGKVGEIVPADQTKFVLLAEDLNALHPLP